MPDVIVLGGGIIGLSIAWELARVGDEVLVIDRTPDQEAPSASWSAAGILPPPKFEEARDALHALQLLSWQRFPDWIAEIEGASGICVEYFSSGGLHLARTHAERTALRASLSVWQLDGVECDWCDPKDLQQLEPALAERLDDGRILGGVHSPREAQLRPPRLLQALRDSIMARGGTIEYADGVPRIECGSSGTLTIQLPDRKISCEQLVVAAGCWSREILQEFDIRLNIEPRRGQMVLFCPMPGLLRHIINEGPKYLVPRIDGRILSGSTVEEVGFTPGVRAEDIEQLVTEARELVPELRAAGVEKSWSGLRPYSGDGLPLLGPVEAYPGLFVATGHFRAGMQTAPGTAQVLMESLGRAPTTFDRSLFRPDRF